MTKTEMEDALKNLEHRPSRVEQILPTLATRQDLHDAFETARRHTDIRVEDVRDDLRKVAEGVATLTMVVQDMGARFERRFETVDRRFETIDRRFEAVDRRFDAIDSRIDTLTAKIDRR